MLCSHWLQFVFELWSFLCSCWALCFGITSVFWLWLVVLFFSWFSFLILKFRPSLFSHLFWFNSLQNFLFCCLLWVSVSFVFLWVFPSAGSDVCFFVNLLISVKANFPKFLLLFYLKFILLPKQTNTNLFPVAQHHVLNNVLSNKITKLDW